MIGGCLNNSRALPWGGHHVRHDVLGCGVEGGVHAWPTANKTKIRKGMKVKKQMNIKIEMGLRRKWK